MDRRKSKKEKILDAALTLFADKGYDGIGMDEIADAVGMKGPALYHYFKGKEAILNELIGEASGYYNKNFGISENEKTVPETMSEFIEMSLARIEFTIHDSKIIKIRKLLAMEQFRNAKLKELATFHHLTGVVNMNAFYFRALSEKGKVKDYDPEILAFEFSAPVTLLIHQIDREPEKEAEVKEKIRKHMEHFASVYAAV